MTSRINGRVACGESGRLPRNDCGTGRANRVLFVLAAVFAFWLMSAAQAHAAPITVCATGPCTYTTIQTAVNKAQRGDTICVQGAITENTITVDKDVTIEGEDPNSTDCTGAAGTTVVNGDSTGRIFTINSGVTVTLQYLTVINGLYSGNGSAVDNFGNLTVSYSNFQNNGAYSGTVTVFGGAIYNEIGATTNATYSTFSDNSAYNGGAIYNVSEATGKLTVSNCTFSGNQAVYEGGAIYNNIKQSILIVTDSTFSGNQAPGGGGSGGAIFNSSNGIATVTNSTFWDNEARSVGGAIMDNGNNATLYVTFSTFSGNHISSGGRGGAIYVEGGGGRKPAVAYLKSSIFAQSYNSYGTMTNCNNDPNDGKYTGILNDVGYNISDDSSCHFTSSTLASTDPMLDPNGLKDNTGPTETIALQPGSPAIDAIPVSDCTDQASPANPIATDQRGVSRPQGPKCDIGAYEAMETAVSISSVKLDVSPSSTPYGTASVTLKGTVNAASTVTEGTITFQNLPTGSSVSGGTVTVSNGQYQATLDLGTSVGVNNYTGITATYSDSSGNFTCPTTAACTSPDASLDVTAVSVSGVTLDVSPPPTPYGTASVTLSGYVNATSTVTEGTITFQNLPGGSSVYGGTVTVGSNGKYQATLEVGTVPVGTYSTITAIYTDSSGNFTCPTTAACTSSGASLQVSQRPITFQPDNKKIFYGQTAPTFTYGVASGSIVNNDSFGTATDTFSNSSYGPSTTPPTGVGVYTITLSGLSNSNYDISYNTGTYTIFPDTTGITYTGATSSVYGQCGTINLSAKLINTVFGVPVVGATLTFKVSDGTNYVEGSATTDSTGTAYLSLNPTGPNALTGLNATTSGSVTVTFAGTATLGGTSIDFSPYEIQAATNLGGVSGNPLYTGAPVFYTSDSTSNTASVALSTTVEDLAGCSGNISTSKVTFGMRNSDGSVTPIPSAENLPVGLVSPTNPYIGSASAITQLSTGNNTYALFDIAVIFGGNYNLNDPTYDALIAVTHPGAANSIVGSGGIDLNAPMPATGYLATGAGTGSSAIPSGSANYLRVAAGVTYNKKGTNPQGKVQVLFNSYDKPDGSIDTVLHTYQIASNSISALSSPTPGTYYFSGKCTVQDVTSATSPISVDGGATFQMTTVNATKDSPAEVQIEVQSKKGNVWLATGWNGTQPVLKAFAINYGEITGN